MEQDFVYFGEQGIIKGAFHENKNPIKINEVDIKEVVLTHKQPYGKIHLITLLDIDIKVMFFYHRYA